VRFKKGISHTRRTNVSQCWSAVVALFTALLVVNAGSQVAAQSDSQVWATAVNLSHSGAASRPVIVTQPDGGLRVFWWDSFDGVTMTETDSFSGPTAEWSDPLPIQIAVLEAREFPAPDGSEFVSKPIAAMPYIFGDTFGQAHAVWLGKADETTGARPLLHARLGETSTNWTTARVLAESAIGFSATVDAAGNIHLAYMRALNTARLPSGVYYRRSDDGGANWQASATVYLSRYLRLLSPEGTHLSVAAGEAGSVYISWRDPQKNGILLAASLDEGRTWQEPTPVGTRIGGAEGQSSSAHFVPGEEPQLLWDVLRPSGACDLYQAPVQEVLAADGEASTHVLPHWEACTPDKQLLALGEGRVLLAAEREDGSLLLADWDGSSWQSSSPMFVQVDDPNLGGRTQLAALSLTLSSPSASEGEDPAQTLAIVGVDGQGEVWITGSQVEALRSLFAPMAPAPAPTPLLRPPGTPGGPDSLSSQPANLSRSGAASDPAIVTGPDGKLRAFWWDAYDGLMVADGAVWSSTVLSGTQPVTITLDTWTDAVRAPISFPLTILGGAGGAPESGAPPQPTTIRAMPRIVADATGRSHAFWAQEPLGLTGLEPLLYSSLDRDSVFWSSVEVLAESAAAFDVAAAGDGRLHLVYLRSRHTGDAAAGVYHRRSDDGGATWSVPAALDTSRYYRLALPDSAHLRLSADGVGNVYVTWDHPHQERLLLAASLDDGATWSEPTTLGGADVLPQHGRLFAMSAGGQSKPPVTWLMWEDASQGGGCVLYQAPVHEALVDREAVGQRVLDTLNVCPQGEQFLAAGTDGVLMGAGAGSDVLTLIIWDGQQWSEPQRHSFHFENLDTGAPVYLGALQSTLVQIPSADRETDPLDAGSWTEMALVILGTDGQGDVWSIPSQMGALEVVFAPPSPWSTPADVTLGTTLPDLPSMAADAEGRVHTLWSEPEQPGSTEKTLRYARWDGERWTRPTTVLRSPEGTAEQPVLVVQGNFLHALWSGGSIPQIWHSWVFVQDANFAAGWSEPQPLPASDAVPGMGGATWPHATASDGVLHVVYAVPVNEGRGIYYVRSEDGGQSWRLPGQVFDAAGLGWTAAGMPRLAVGAQGSVHVVWVHSSLSLDRPPQGIYYAFSEDEGETWSEPLEVAKGAYTWPQVVASETGQMHVLWNEAAEGGVWHRWSPGGSSTRTETVEGWTRAERMAGWSNVRGPMGLAADGAGRLHLASLGLDDSGESALLYTTWGDAAEPAAADRRWTKQEVFRLGLEPDDPGIGMALQPALGKLDIVFVGQEPEGEEPVLKGLWHTGRAVSPAGASPPTAVPTRPTEAPLSTPTPGPTPTATRDLAGGPPPPGTDSTGPSLPFLLGGGLAALIVAVFFGTRSLLARRR
jgi:hypothetical protein